MESTCPEAVLDACLRGAALEPLLPGFRRFAAQAADSIEASRALFGILAEGLSDRFEPALTKAYATLFSEAIACVLPEHSASGLRERYERIRRPRKPKRDPARVYVLSRVTLGADAAITSVVLDGVKRRFPRAEIFLAGGIKCRELFAADPRIRHLPVSYERFGTLRERLLTGAALAAELGDGIVIDPDSRLTQLGLLPVCPEENYFFFESRAYGGESGESVTDLTRRWMGETFGVEDARPYIAPPPCCDSPDVTVSFGVGGNPAKRVPDPFEGELLRALAARDLDVLADTGAGGEEAARVERAVERCGGRVRAFRGWFSQFAARIARSRLYIGYDSAGQHAAAACGTPLVTVFAGFASPRMFARWQPTGPGPKQVIRVDRPDPEAVLAETLRAVSRQLFLRQV